MKDGGKELKILYLDNKIPTFIKNKFKFKNKLDIKYLFVCHLYLHYEHTKNSCFR